MQPRCDPTTRASDIASHAIAARATSGIRRCSSTTGIYEWQASSAHSSSRLSPASIDEVAMQAGQCGFRDSHRQMKTAGLPHWKERVMRAMSASHPSGTSCSAIFANSLQMQCTHVLIEIEVSRRLRCRSAHRSRSQFPTARSLALVQRLRGRRHLLLHISRRALRGRSRSVNVLSNMRVVVRRELPRVVHGDGGRREQTPAISE